MALIALHMECLLLLLPGVVKPTRAGVPTAQGREGKCTSGSNQAAVKPWPGFSYRGPSLAAKSEPDGRISLVRRGERTYSYRYRRGAGGVYFTPPAPPLLPPRLTWSLCAFRLSLSRLAIALPLQRAQAAASSSYPLFRQASGPLSVEFSVSALPKERHPEPNDSGSSRVPGPGQGKAGMRMERGAE